MKSFSLFTIRATTYMLESVNLWTYESRFFGEDEPEGNPKKTVSL